MVQILSHEYNSVKTTTSFKILSIIFNLDHEMDSLHFISNGEDPSP